MKTEVLTLKEYQGFQRAYDFFNRELFAGSLPQVLVTLQRHANTRGYFAPFRFKGRIDKQSVHELALNPDNFTGRSDERSFRRLCMKWRTSGRRLMENPHAVGITTGNGRVKCERSAYSPQLPVRREERKPAGRQPLHYP